LKKYKVLDIFCGAGGFTCGMEQSDFEVLAGVDIDATALRTFSRNHKNSIAIEHDLSNVDDELISTLRKASPSGFDVIVGGPPCQGFSVAGKRLEEDPRNSLWTVYIKLIEAFRPKIIFLENVPSILSLYKGKVAEQIKESFEFHGYKTQVKTIMASDYGVPQNRKRTFFVAVDNSINEIFCYPEPISKKVTTEEAINDLPLLDTYLGGELVDYELPAISDYQKLMRKSSQAIYNHSAVNHKPKTKMIIAKVPDGGNYKDLPESLQGTRKVNIAWTRMNSKQPCFTIDAGHNHHFHYKANRVPTVRECARIQSFPDTFVFEGNRTSQYRQVGNAVPPLLGFSLGSEALKVLRNHDSDEF
jgi:DNA (cytosine-5)-methyltransferase 1